MALFYPRHPHVDVHLLRLANHIATGGAELNDIRRLVEAVPEFSPEPWYAAWMRSAEHEQRAGDAAAAAHHPETAREHWLKASNYFREASFYLPHADPRKRSAYEASRAAFQQALPLLPHPAQMLEVDWVPPGQTDTVRLPGYLWAPPGPGERPGVVFIGGADATKEELYFTGGRRLVERGFVVLVIDGPGQGETRMLRNQLAVAEWETLAAPLFSAIANRPEVNPERIGLLGISMGGYYAPRLATAGEPFRCVAVWGACFDVLEDLYRFAPAIRSQLEGITGTTAETAPEVLARFTLREVADRITIPVLITHGDADALVRPQAATDFAAALKAPYTLRMYPGAVHCMYDRPAEAEAELFDWLRLQLR